MMTWQIIQSPEKLGKMSHMQIWWQNAKTNMDVGQELYMTGNINIPWNYKAEI